MASTVDLSLYFPDEKQYLHVLSIPSQACSSFSTKPLKWLRYLGYTIYGRHGHIFSSPNFVEHLPHVDYDGLFEPGHYYYRSQEPLQIFDVDCMDDNVTSSDISIRRSGFRQMLIQRDQRCVLTGSPADVSTAMHIMPHSKGDDYMSNLLLQRGLGIDDGMQDFDGINDVHNGFLAHEGFHRWFGSGGFGFLKIPNFALDHSDIPNIPSPLPSSATQYIVHHFAPERDPLMATLAANNSIARLFEGPDFPPSLITDMWYGCCVFQIWKVSGIEEQLENMSKKHYYDDQQDDGVYDPTQCRESHRSQRNQRGTNSGLNDKMDGSPGSAPQLSTFRPAIEYISATHVQSARCPSAMSSVVDIISSFWSRVPRDVVQRRQERRREIEATEMDQSLSRAVNWLEWH